MRKRGLKSEMKRGLSPVIATVLLISIVIILALIVLLWAMGFIKEVIEKEGKSAEQACDEIVLDASLSEDRSEIYIINNGNIPVYKVEIIVKKGFSSIREAFEIDLSTGQSTIQPLSDIVEENDEVEIIPAVLGTAKNQQTIYTCVNNPIKIQ